MRKAIEQFAELMEQKLKKNSHKRHWSRCSNRFLRHEMRGNYEALLVAIETGGDPETIISKATNIANFAMMIANNAGRQGPRKKG